MSNQPRFRTYKTLDQCSIVSEGEGLIVDMDGDMYDAKECQALVSQANLSRSLYEALENLKGRAECWCEASVDNPMMRGYHSIACKSATAALAQAKESLK